MYDPIKLSKKIEDIVIKDNMKKYYRFRPAGFYGGIATADTVGCNLRCKFCWSSNSVWNADNVGEFHSPESVAEILNSIANKKGYHQIRISGGEPTIGKKHLITLLENIDPNYLFVLETNGILLGENKTYIKELSKFKNLHFRICFKGLNPKEFSMLTGAKNGFDNQLKALEYLKEYNLNFNIAIVSVKTDKKCFFDKLSELGLKKIMIEEEEIKLYPLVRKRLLDEKLLHFFE
ncbi:hypothetical protein AYK24_07585 [Thermoplasmatales archaeon SG8-52-4]|nr:MAG: hypothetical protein AYK24_07585 [Thermoplasmatales archaeon SG8-52-4]